jgi:hypothetical protein
MSTVHRNPTVERTRRVNKMTLERGATTLASFFPFPSRNSPARERAARETVHGAAHVPIHRRVRSLEGECAAVELVRDGTLKRLWGILNGDLRREVPRRPSSQS